MTESREDAVAHAVAHLDEVRHRWLSYQGVTGVDVGFLYEDGRPTDTVGIRVKVRRKLPPAEVPPGELIPPSLGDVPVQVVESVPGPE